MNQPDRYSRFVSKDGEKKISYAKDSRMPNAGTFTIMREDHTLGNLIRCRLLEEKRVVFAGYRIPHPLETRMEIKVQTTGDSLSPQEALKGAIVAIDRDLKDLQIQFSIGAGDAQPEGAQV